MLRVSTADASERDALCLCGSILWKEEEVSRSETENVCFPLLSHYEQR